MTQDSNKTNNLMYLIKAFLGILVIATLIEMRYSLRGDNFWINICVAIPMWMAILTFMDWRPWVKN